MCEGIVTVKKENPGCALIIFSLSLIPIFCLINAWILSVMWRWFAVPIFGLRQLSVGGAIGLSCLVSAIQTANPAKTTDKPLSELVSTAIVHVTMKAGVLLLLGWIAKSLM